MAALSPANPGSRPMSESSNVSKPAGIVMYESDWCGFCRAARRLLQSKGWEFESRLVDGNAALRAEMQERSGRTSVPQVFFGDRHIGGFDDMAALEEKGELDAAYADIQ